jgi:sensor histidine kinase YesM
MNFVSAIKNFSKKHYSLLFYTFYVLLVYVFWFLYGWRMITDFYSAFKLVLFATPYLIGFWFNKKVLFPRFFMKGKFISYLFFTVFSFFVLYFVQSVTQLDSIYDCPKMFQDFTPLGLLRDMLISQITFFMFCGLGITINLVETWIKNMTEIEDLKSEKLKAELNSLKNQLSPHFLFNTLNMVHILTKTNPAIASEVTLELAELMRYQLYGASKEVVKIEEEVRFIQNLLKIEKLRKENLKLNFQINVESLEQDIQPLILAPLVENALKHGSQQMEGPEINILLESSGGRLDFKITNSYRVSKKLNGHKAGTGLVNLKRRLELGYENKFSLQTSKENGYFIAELTILA